MPEVIKKATRECDDKSGFVNEQYQNDALSIYSMAALMRSRADEIQSKREVWPDPNNVDYSSGPGWNQTVLQYATHGGGIANLTAGDLVLISKEQLMVGPPPHGNYRAFSGKNSAKPGQLNTRLMDTTRLGVFPAKDVSKPLDYFFLVSNRSDVMSLLR